MPTQNFSHPLLPPYQENGDLWTFLEATPRSTVNSRHAMGLILKATSHPNPLDRMDAIDEVLALGLPSALLAEECMIHGQFDTLPALREKVGHLWHEWPRPHDLVRDEAGEEKIESMMMWLLRRSGPWDTKAVVDYLVTHEAAHWDTLAPIAVNWSPHLNFRPVGDTLTPLAFAAFHGQAEPTLALLQDPRVLAHQDSLDEALFVIWNVVLSGHDKSHLEDNPVWQTLSIALIEAGANPNRSFAVGFPPKPDHAPFLWDACAGLALCQQFLEQDSRHVDLSALEAVVYPVLEPATWPHRTNSGGTDELARMLPFLCKGYGAVHAFPEQALSAIARGPVTLDVSHFVMGVLPMILKMKDIDSFREDILAEHDKIDKARYRTPDELWAMVLRNHAPSRVLRWAARETGRALTREEVLGRMDAKDLGAYVALDLEKVLGSADAQWWEETRAAFSVLCRGHKGLSADEVQVRETLFVENLKDPAPAQPSKGPRL
jgi:hypothetical protein